jgi:transposase
MSVFRLAVLHHLKNKTPQDGEVVDSYKLLSAALSIQDPWFIEDIEFDPDQKTLEVYINFIKGSTFRSSNPDIEGAFKAYDTQLKKWRHMNFFEHECYLCCWTPRIKTGEHTIETVSPPWAGLNPGCPFGKPA